MLQLITDALERQALQAEFKRCLEDQLDYQGQINIGYQGGGGIYPLYSHGPGTLYFAYSPPSDENAVPRHWNSFGVYRPGESFGIVVEINIPVGADTAMVAGFFARNRETGAVFALHDGRVGGGRKGIGKDSFLAWMGEELVLATAPDVARAGIIVGEVGSPDLANQIWRFVQKVDRFKAAAAGGHLDTQGFKHKREEYANYRKEFVGRKSGSRAGVFSYETYHGAVVDALFNERVRNKKPGEQIANSAFIDLLVKRGGKLTEIYEVKCTAERQTLYAGIGQLLTHSAGQRADVIKTLVLPRDERVASDIQCALDELGVRVRRYSLTGKPKARKVQLL